MKLTFLGTRGLIEASSSRHPRHSSLLIEQEGRRVLVDCGADWRDDLPRLSPDAIVLTHAHPDHVQGLAPGAPCPVYASAETWQLIEDFPITERQTLPPGDPLELCGLTINALPVHHSLRAPAVGLRISDGTVDIFYAPDVAELIDATRCLKGARAYIGDGSCLDDALLRMEQGQPCGHAPVSTQLDWCALQGVHEAIFTHFGTEIVAGAEEQQERRIEALAAKMGLRARFAFHRMTLQWH